ncbi:hypothetical protein ABH935_005505 [Catenulispora sp. GAS73]|uniref:hypothetical protein n=1 Tax=Catenulispora sp. GAS73 TaxID=3156269 RepID=UPI003516BD66
MTPLVVVHGVFNHVRGATPEQAAKRKAAEWRPRLASGFGKLSAAAPELAVAYYADLLRRQVQDQAQAADDDNRFDVLSRAERVLAAEWLAAAGAMLPADPQNVGLAPLRQLLGWLIDARGGIPGTMREQTIGRLERTVVANLREVEAYTTWPDRRRLVRERVAETIRREQPKVVVAHSLGSYVTYETLHAFPDLTVDLLVTLGSPLRVPSLARRLDPGLRAERGARPAGVGRWVNIADVGDLVAVPPGLGKVFPVDVDESCDTGLGFHGLGGYLANGLTAAAIAPYIS